MQYLYGMMLMVSLVGCVHDMATYTRFSSCGGEKIVTIAPNTHGVDDDVYRETVGWLEKNMGTQGYRFDLQQDANVVVTIKHAVVNTKDDGPADDIQEVYEGEGAPQEGPLYHHTLTLILDDQGCSKESMSLQVILDTYNARFTDSMPELLEALSETFANTAGPRSKTVKKITRKI